VAKRKLPILKPSEVVTKLIALGFEEVRQKGSHKQFRHATELPEPLAADLLEIVSSSDDFDSLPDSFGVKYVVRGVLRTPSGRVVPLQSIWMIEQSA
jgi:hypothetical protein